jgi:hypothetical protein
MSLKHSILYISSRCLRIRIPLSGASGAYCPSPALTSVSSPRLIAFLHPHNSKNRPKNDAIAQYIAQIGRRVNRVTVMVTDGFPSWKA